MGIEFIVMDKDESEFHPFNKKFTLHFTVSQLYASNKRGPFSDSITFYSANREWKFTVIQPYGSKNNLVLKTNLYLLTDMDKSGPSQAIEMHFEVSLLKIGTGDKCTISSIPTYGNFSISQARSIDINLDLRKIHACYMEEDKITLEFVFIIKSDELFDLLSQLNIRKFLAWNKINNKQKWDELRALKEQLANCCLYKTHLMKALALFESGENRPKFECEITLNGNRKVRMEVRLMDIGAHRVSTPGIILPRLEY